MHSSPLNKSIEPILQMIPVISLREDPLNYEAFSMSELEALADDIKKDGFFGEISAYPIEDGLYRIESGHRRFRAAQMAGMNELPVSITIPPSTMVERRLRLTQWNQNTRSFTPMDVAKLVSFTYDTFVIMKKQGQLQGSLIEHTARELGISTSNVSKYKMLLSLTDDLQNLAASGNYSWAHLAAAAVLNEEGQLQLYKNIVNEEKIHPITGSWITKRVEQYKHMPGFLQTRKSGNHMKTFSQSDQDVRTKTDRRSWLYASHSSDRGDDYISQRENLLPSSDEFHRNSETKEIRITEEKTKKTRYRRCDGTKGIRRASGILHDALSEEALIKESEKTEVIALLHEMQEMIDQAMERLSEE